MCPEYIFAFIWLPCSQCCPLPICDITKRLQEQDQDLDHKTLPVQKSQRLDYACFHNSKPTNLENISEEPNSW